MPGFVLLETDWTLQGDSGGKIYLTLFFARVYVLWREQKENLLSCYDGENTARQMAERSGLQLLRWRIHQASAIFLIPVALEASGPSQCCGCFSPESWYCYPDLVLSLTFLKRVKAASFSFSWDCNC